MNEVRAEGLAQVAQGMSHDGFENEHPYWKQWYGWKKGDPFPTEEDVPTEAWYMGRDRQLRLAKINKDIQDHNKNKEVDKLLE